MRGNDTAFLRRTLLTDAVVSGFTGLAMVAAAGLLGNLFALPETLLRFAGLFLLPYAACVAFVGRPTNPARSAVWLVIVANTMWVIGSALMLVLGWAQPNALGYAFVIGQAVVVGVFTEWQFFGLKRTQTPQGATRPGQRTALRD